MREAISQKCTNKNGINSSHFFAPVNAKEGKELPDLCLSFRPLSFPRENILKTAKTLVEDTKLLVSGAASSQEKLAQAAQSSASTITQLAEVVKLGAASLGSDDPETQVCAEGCHGIGLAWLGGGRGWVTPKSPRASCLRLGF